MTTAEFQFFWYKGGNRPLRGIEGETYTFSECTPGYTTGKVKVERHGQVATYKITELGKRGFRAELEGENPFPKYFIYQLYVKYQNLC